nr:PREDICTED: TCR gamma alternate reading frame protein [Apteryx mantelli mantelli]
MVALDGSKTSYFHPSGVCAQTLQQTPISITKPESKTVLISCRVSAPDFATAFIHWYRKRLNAAPEHIAYMSSRLFLANSSDDGKFNGEAQVLLKQHQTSVTQGKTKTARIDCIAEGISNFQAAYIHWYRHIPSKGPEWLLYIKSAEEVGYDQDSYKSKYSAAKKGKNVCTLSVNDINPNDEGTYCCAYWESHRTSRPLIAYMSTQKHLTPISASITRQRDRNKEFTVLLLARDLAVYSVIKKDQKEIQRGFSLLDEKISNQILVKTSLLFGSEYAHVYLNQEQISPARPKGNAVCTYCNVARITGTFDGSMLLLPVLLVTSFWSRGDAQAIPQQSPELLSKVENTSASMACRIDTNTYIHWYHQRPGQPPQRILYVSGQTPTFDDSGSSWKFKVQKHPSEPFYILRIDDLTPKDSGVYYCAYWFYQESQHQKGKRMGYLFKVFGSGTKLIVSDKGTSAPKSYEVLSSENENKLTYVCLVEKFYPEVIRVTWTEGGDEVIDNVVNGEVWKSDDDQYSIGSWLTVPKENKNKKYLCKYEHESNEQSFAPPSTQDLTKTAEKQDCNATSGNSRIFYGDHLMHRTAYLVYIVLLLKSSMYYVIVLFFVYRMRTPAKHHGKKT